MNRSEAYAEGFQEGRRWAEEDIRDRTRDTRYPSVIFNTDAGEAYQLGAERGYRDTWARWDAGTLTWEQLEHAPVGR